MTIDDLLSSEEVLTIAEEDQKQKESHVRDLVFGMLDCSIAMFFLLPFFGQKTDGVIREVSLLSLTEISSWLKAAYFAVLLGLIVWGILTLALQNCHLAVWVRNKHNISLAFNAAGALLFIISLQPYAATVLFIFLAVKALLLINK